MKKLLTALLAIIAIAIIGIFIIASTVLDSMVQKGVETFAPDITQTKVTLESVDISPLSGSGGINGLFIGNPEGFSSSKVCSIEQVEVDVDIQSLLGDHIIVEKILVKQPEFVYEKTLTSSNIDQLLANIEEATGGKKEETPEKEQAAPIKFEIKEFILDGGSVSVATLGTEVGVPMPKIVLKDIGRDKGGITPSEAATEIMSVVLKQVSGSAVEGIKNIGGKLGEGAEGAAKGVGDAVKGVGDKLKGLFGK